MMDICTDVHTLVSGHQEDEEGTDQPLMTAFEGDYLTFERVKVALTAK